MQQLLFTVTFAILVSTADLAPVELPALFPGPSDASHEEVFSKAQFMEKLTQTAFEAVSSKLRAHVRYEDVRMLLGNIVSLENEHPSLPVTLRELRDAGAFGESGVGAPAATEWKALGCLKQLKLVVTRNSTVSTRARAWRHHFQSTEDALGQQAVQDRQRHSLARAMGIEPTAATTGAQVASSSAATWAGAVQPEHPHPAKVLLVTTKDWPGATLVGEMVNRDPTALYFVEPCRAYEKQMAGPDGKGEAERLLGPQEGAAQGCVDLVLRLLGCSFTEEDSEFVFADKFTLSKMHRVARASALPDRHSRHASLTQSCRASRLRVVREDKVVEVQPFSAAEGSLAKAILASPHGLRILHLVRDPRALLLARLLAPPPRPLSAGGETSDEFATRLAEHSFKHRLACGASLEATTANKKRRLTRATTTKSRSRSSGSHEAAAAAYNVGVCTKWSCGSFAHSLDAVERLMRLVFGSTANLQAIQGTRQFLRIRFEDLAMSPWASLAKVYTWACGIPPSAAELSQWAYDDATVQGWAAKRVWSKGDGGGSQQQAKSAKLVGGGGGGSGGGSGGRRRKSGGGRLGRRLTPGGGGEGRHGSSGSFSGNSSSLRRDAEGDAYVDGRVEEDDEDHQPRESQKDEENPIIWREGGRLKTRTGAARRRHLLTEAGERSGGVRSRGSKGVEADSERAEASLARVMAWAVQLSERQVHVATRECADSLRRLEYASQEDLANAEQGKVSLPHWAWAQVPTKRNLVLPVGNHPKNKNKKPPLHS